MAYAHVHVALINRLSLLTECVYVRIYNIFVNLVHTAGMAINAVVLATVWNCSTSKMKILSFSFPVSKLFLVKILFTVALSYTKL